MSDVDKRSARLNDKDREYAGRNEDKDFCSREDFHSPIGLTMRVQLGKHKITSVRFLLYHFQDGRYVLIISGKHSMSQTG